MAELTDTYDFKKPAVGGDENSWGGYLNDNWDLVDSILDGTHATLKVNLDGYTLDGITINNPDSDVEINVETLNVDGKITETVHALGTSGTIDLDPANGTIQTIATAGNVTFDATSVESGQFVTLQLEKLFSHAITWPTMEWIGGAAPTLSYTQKNWIHIWRVGTQLFGSYIGASA